MEDGTEVQIRPIRPEDEALLIPFHEALSDDSVYLRYAEALGLRQRVAPHRLGPRCLIDPDREAALVAIQETASGADLLAVGRLFWDAPRHDRASDGEFALLVRDDVQGQGLGTDLLRRLIEIGRGEELAAVVGYVLSWNDPMLRVARALGCTPVRTADDLGAGSTVTLRLSLSNE